MIIMVFVIIIKVLGNYVLKINFSVSEINNDILLVISWVYFKEKNRHKEKNKIK
jgi:hypothetical protein